MLLEDTAAEAEGAVPPQAVIDRTIAAATAAKAMFFSNFFHKFSPFLNKLFILY